MIGELCRGTFLISVFKGSRVALEKWQQNVEGGSRETREEAVAGCRRSWQQFSPRDRGRGGVGDKRPRSLCGAGCNLLPHIQTSVLMGAIFCGLKESLQFGAGWLGP